jgi:hypothetical protein
VWPSGEADSGRRALANRCWPRPSVGPNQPGSLSVRRRFVVLTKRPSVSPSAPVRDGQDSKRRLHDLEWTRFPEVSANKGHPHWRHVPAGLGPGRRAAPGGGGIGRRVPERGEPAAGARGTVGAVRATPCSTCPSSGRSIWRARCSRPTVARSAPNPEASSDRIGRIGTEVNVGTPLVRSETRNWRWPSARGGVAAPDAGPTRHARAARRRQGAAARRGDTRRQDRRREPGGCEGGIRAGQGAQRPRRHVNRDAAGSRNQAHKVAKRPTRRPSIPCTRPEAILQDRRAARPRGKASQTRSSELQSPASCRNGQQGRRV